MKKRILFVIMAAAIGLTACASKEEETGRRGEYIEDAKRLENDDGFTVWAQKRWQEALAVSVEETGENSADTAYVCQRIGNISRDLAEAEPWLERASRIYTGLGDSAGLGEVSQAYGKKCVTEGDMEKALDYFRQAAEYYEKAEQPSPAQIYELCQTMALLVEAPEAMDCYRQCEAVLDQLEEDEQPLKRAETRGNIAMTHARLGEYEAAITEYKAAADLYQKAGMEQTLELGETYDSLGEGYLAAGDLKRAGRYFEKAVDIFLNIRVNDYYRQLVDVSDAYEHLSTVTAMGENPDYQKALEYGVRACRYFSERTLEPEDIQALSRRKETLRGFYGKVHGEAAADADFEEWFRQQADIRDRKIREGSYLEPELLYFSDGDMIYMSELLPEEIPEYEEIAGHIREARFDQALAVIDGLLAGDAGGEVSRLYNLQGIVYGLRADYEAAAEAFLRAGEAAVTEPAAADQAAADQAAMVQANNCLAAYTLAGDSGEAGAYAAKAASYAGEDAYNSAIIEYNRLRLQIVLDLERMGILFAPMSVTMHLGELANLEKDLTGESGILVKNIKILWAYIQGIDTIWMGGDEVWEYIQEAERITAENECRVLVENRLNDIKAMYYYSSASFYEDAKRLEQPVLETSEAVFGRDSLPAARSAMNMAIICLGSGRYEEAAEYYQRVMSIIQPDSMEAALFYYKLGNFYIRKVDEEKEKDKAVYYYMASYKIAEWNGCDYFVEFVDYEMSSTFGADKIDSDKFVSDLEEFDIQSIELLK